jgi:hypothetical protein
MSNHFTGLSLGPPLGDQRLDLCDLYAFQSPSDNNRTVIILNANPNADALHPDAIYRVNIDADGDYLTDIALSYVFSKPQNGRQTFSVFMAKGEQSRSPEATGNKIVTDAESRSEESRISFAPAPMRFSPAAAATRSSSISTASRTCSTSVANGTSPNRISAASHLGPVWIRTPRPMYSRRRSSCRRASSVPNPKSTSGGAAACTATASSCTSIAPVIRA